MTDQTTETRSPELVQFDPLDFDYERVHIETDDVDDADEDTVYETRLAALYACTDSQRHGHQFRRGQQPSADPAQPEAPSEEAQAAAKAAASAERRRVIDYNKAWDSATGVRVQWLRTFLSRKTAPQGASVFTAQAPHPRRLRHHPGARRRVSSRARSDCTR